MGKLDQGWKRFRSWWGRSRTDRPGPDSHHHASAAHDEAKFRAQMDTSRGINNL
jgi:hypothetical protein